MRKRLSTEDYKNGILAGDRGILGKAVTLVESKLKEDQQTAQKLLQDLMPFTGKSLRIAITGVPGAGKSTIIESLGKHLTHLRKKVAVLAVDPTSNISKGSILGDKTRMEELSKDPLAFIRPSPTGDSMSGITQKTRESILLCEAAGYEIILIETVGVGQIETQVHGMVDLFILVILTGAGDELQLIKKGVMELADLIIINKADGLNKEKSIQLQREMEKTMSDFPETTPGWKTKILAASALENEGMEKIWSNINSFHLLVSNNGNLKKNREAQQLEWMKENIRTLLEENFYNSEVIKEKLKSIENKVATSELSAVYAAEFLLDIFKKYKH